MNLPFSQACENNKHAILDVLTLYLKNSVGSVLEIGSGTAQHVVFFAKTFSQLQWQTSDQQQYLNGIRARLKAQGSDNILFPIELDVRKEWPKQKYDHVLTANTCHIMAKESVVDLFKGISVLQKTAGYLFIYGPFKYQGKFTTASNEQFDAWLKGNNPESGIRDFEYINLLAEAHQYQFVCDHQMPANNQLLVFKKS